MTKKAVAKLINKTPDTLRSWEKENPKLVELIYLGLEKKELIKNENINILFDQLTKDEQRMYLAEIENRILKRKLENKETKEKEIEEKN